MANFDIARALMGSWHPPQSGQWGSQQQSPFGGLGQGGWPSMQGRPITSFGGFGGQAMSSLQPGQSNQPLPSPGAMPFGFGGRQPQLESAFANASQPSQMGSLMSGAPMGFGGRQGQLKSAFGI